MYDMYPWDEGSASAAPSGAAPSGAAASGAPAGPAAPAAPSVTPGPAPAVSAVQVALDRRDNGGETAAAAGTPPLIPARQ